MYRIRMRLVQRVVVLTSISLFGSITMWFTLFTKLEVKQYDGMESRRATQVINTGLSHGALLNERLDGQTLTRDLHRNSFVNVDLKRSSSSVVRNVFGIRPAVVIPTWRLRAEHDNNYEKEIMAITMDQQESDTHKYTFVFHHYEQLGKTTENFVQLCSIAAYGSRFVVEPFVRDSRMCGLESGWWGESLTKSRLFKPFNLYFDVKCMNELLTQNHFASTRPLTEFKENCNELRSTLTIVHFLYRDGKETTMKWFQLSESAYQRVYIQTNSTGWTDCPFIDQGLNITKRLGKMKAGRQLCVNAEKMLSYELFENDVLKGDNCVVITYWKGVGINRTHFKRKAKLNERDLVHKLRHSNVILQEAELYRRIFLEKNYIGLHVRSERQLLWYSAERFLKCVDAAIRTVLKLKQEHGIDNVFMATDLTQYGSDTLMPKSNAKNLKEFEKRLSDRLRPRLYSPHQRDPSLMDHGVVAIVEMNILSQARHLVTIGSGTFQDWIIALFVEAKKDRIKDWTILRVCSKEIKKY